MELISTIKREFASGAEARAYYLKLGFETVENSVGGVIVMDDGTDIVQIRHEGLLTWVATEIHVGGL